MRAKYTDLWTEARKRYVMVCPLDKIKADQLEAMLKDGVLREELVGSGAGAVRFVTTDAKVAEKYGMVEESEWWDSDAGE